MRKLIKWKTLSSKIIYTHPYIMLIEDEIILPNGKKTIWLKYYERTGKSVTIICQNNRGKILVQKEYSYPIRKKIYQFPGGYIKVDEDPIIGAKNELLEETGFIPSSLTHLGYYFANDRRSDSKVYVFLAKDLNKGNMQRDPEEEDNELFWFSEDEIDLMINRGDIVQNNFLSSWQLYKVYK